MKSSRMAIIFFHPNGQKFLHINITSEKPSEVSGNCGVLP